MKSFDEMLLRDFEQVAYHEAGHAALLFDARITIERNPSVVDRVTALERPTFTGKTRFCGKVDPIAALAGLVAPLLFDSEDAGEITVEEIRDIIEDRLELESETVSETDISGIGSTDLGELRELIEATISEVQHHWEVVKALVSELLEEYEGDPNRSVYVVTDGTVKEIKDRFCKK